jgi:hypothetical protein
LLTLSFAFSKALNMNMSAQEEENDLQSQLISTRKNNISKKSRENYGRCITHYLCWLYTRSPQRFTPGFIRACSRRGVLDASLTREYLEKDYNTALKFDKLKVTDFMTWIVFIRDRESQKGKQLSFGTYAQHRSAFNFLFTLYKASMSDELSQELAIHFDPFANRTLQFAGF